jgi:SPP1 gp7 family putative phage head morphogenesis protein
MTPTNPIVEGMVDIALVELQQGKGLADILKSFAFDPDEPRDEQGRWSEGGTGGGSGTTKSKGSEYTPEELARLDAAIAADKARAEASSTTPPTKAKAARQFVTVYHGSAKAVGDKIRAEGLKPQPGARVWSDSDPVLYEGERGNSVYVTTDEDLAVNYAMEAAAAYHRKTFRKTFPLLVKVKVPKDEWEKGFKLDEHEPSAKYRVGGIPKEWVKGADVLDDGGFLKAKLFAEESEGVTAWSVVLTYDADMGSFDPKKLAPPDFGIELGPEKHEPINDDWAVEQGLRKVEKKKKAFAKEDHAFHTDYERIDKALTGLEDKAKESLKQALTEVRDHLIKKVEKGFDGSPKFIKDFQTKSFKPVRDVVRGFLRDTFDMGRQDIRLEAPTYAKRYEFNEDEPRDETGKWTSGTGYVTVYHGTHEQVADKIKSEGLLPNEFSSEKGDRAKSSFVTDSKDVALNYARGAAANHQNITGKKVDALLIEMRVPKHEWEKFKVDDVETGALTGKHIPARYRVGGIPKEWISGIHSLDPRSGEVKKKLFYTEEHATAWAAALCLGDKKKYTAEELIKKFAKDPPFTPRDALQYLEQKTLQVTDVLDNRLTDAVKQVLLNAIKFGEPLKVTIGKLEDLFTPYLGDDTVLTDGEPLSPFRLETIVRTNSTDAYNMGRLIQARDPDLEGFISGMLYSAVLDSRTTEICQFLDGNIIPMDEPALDRLTPPNHFQCRSILVAVPEGVAIEGYNFITQEDIGAALDMIQDGFK